MHIILPIVNLSSLRRVIIVFGSNKQPCPCVFTTAIKDACCLNAKSHEPIPKCSIIVGYYSKRSRVRMAYNMIRESNYGADRVGSDIIKHLSRADIVAPT